MKYSEIKELKSFCENLHSEPEWREVIEEVLDGSDDFTISDVRFIADSEILDVMVDEIFSDDYTLGCFNADFISSHTKLNSALVKACQDSAAFEAIGQAMNDTMDRSDKVYFCDSYAMVDGYGHHFNSYDGNSEEVTINGNLYHVFDNH